MGALHGSVETSHQDIVRSLPLRWSASEDGTAQGSSRHAVAAATFGRVCKPGFAPDTLELPAHKRRCVFVDATQQIIAAASGDDFRDARTKRKRTTASQLDVLVASFALSDAPNYEVREELATRCDMTNREVQVWFQNRRAKVLRERQRASELEEPGSASPSARSDASASTRAALSSQSRWRPDPRDSNVASAYTSYPYALASRAPEALRLPGISRRAPPTTENWTVYWRHQPEPVRSPSASSLSGSDSLSPPASTPSLVSPGPRSASSYFSISEPATPQSLPSPTSAFFRLALESPQATAPVDWFDEKESESFPMPGTAGETISSTPPSPRNSHLSSPPHLTLLDPTLHARATFVQSAPPSPSMAHSAFSHRVPSLRNLLNPAPSDSEVGAGTQAAIGTEAALLVRSLSDSSRPRSPPRGLARPPLGRRAVTFETRLATIVSRSPSAFDADSAHSHADHITRRTSLALTESDAALPSSARPHGGEPAGLGILAAAAVYVDSQHA
ncbi:hypothetical protein JCM3774_005134 [Rhodotorula dairenensis]